MTVAADDPGQTRAAEWLAAWDSHGLHRTATAGDRRGADWLAATARGLGATVAVETFALQRIDPGPSFVEVDGIRIEGVPLFDAPDTAPGGVSGLASADTGEGAPA